jgi:hypothetical protein
MPYLGLVYYKKSGKSLKNGVITQTLPPLYFGRIFLYYVCGCTHPTSITIYRENYIW